MRRFAFLLLVTMSILAGCGDGAEEDVAPVRARIVREFTDATGSFYGLRFENRSGRPVQEVAFRIDANDKAGRPLPPEGLSAIFRFPVGKPLNPGESRDDKIPRDPAARRGRIQVTEILFASGEPVRWFREE